MFGYYWSGWGVDANVTVGTAKDDQHVDGAFWTDIEPGDDSSEEEADIKLSYALSLGYTTPDVLFGPISIRAGWGAAYFEDENAGDPDPKAYDGNVYDQYGQWAASITWGTLNDGLYLSVMGQNRNFELFGRGAHLGSLGAYADEYDVTGIEFVVAYGFANGVTLMTGYEWQQIDYDFSTPTDLDSDAKSSVIPVPMMSMLTTQTAFTAIMTKTSLLQALSTPSSVKVGTAINYLTFYIKVRAQSPHFSKSAL